MKTREPLRILGSSANQTTLLVWAIIIFSLAVVIQVVMTWMILPIYPDEIATRVLGSRLFIDKFERYSMLGVCTSSNSVQTPGVLLPAAALLSLLSYIVDMSYNRIVAFCGLLLCFCLVYLSFSRTAGRSTRVIALCLCVLASSIGVVAAAYFIIRPENFIFLLVALAIFTFSDNRDSRTNFVIAIAAVLLFTMSLYLHPKTLYFLPVTLMILVRTITFRHTMLLALSVFILAWASFEGYLINAKQFLNCPEVPALEALLNSFNVNPTLLFTHPVKFLTDLLVNNISGRWVSIGRQISFTSGYGSRYLPDVTVSAAVSICNILIRSVALGTLLSAVFFGLKHLSAVRHSIFSRPNVALAGEKPSEDSDSIDHAGMLFLYIGTTTYLLLNATQAWYDISAWTFIYAALVTTSVTRFYGRLVNIDAWRGSHRARPDSAARWGICCVTAVILCTAGFSAVILRTTIYRDLTAGYNGPSIPLVTSNFSEIGKNVHRAAAMCGLSSKSPRLIVDDLTYPFLQQSYKPYLITYGLFATPERFYALAKREGSNGMVVRCGSIPATPQLDGMKRDGDICCFNSGP